MNEQDTIRHLAGSMVSILVWVENNPRLEPEHIVAVRKTKTRLRLFSILPWRVKLPVVGQFA